MNNLDQWQELSYILDHVDKKGLKSLSTDQLLEFGSLYRRCVSALSHARAHGLDPEQTRYLNHLVGRAYGHVYVAMPNEERSIWRFFRYTFPATVRDYWMYLAAATLFIVGVATVTAMLVKINPDLAWQIVPNEFEFIGEMVVERHERGGDWLPITIRPNTAAEIMTNNVQVSFLAFAGGIIFGLGTLYILYYNGVMLGAIVAAFSQAPADAALNFWGFVAPHGVIELPAIFLAAMAGLMLGYALINPGDHDRKTALKLIGRQAINIIMGVVMILIIAGLIEGFFSPALIAEPIKFTFAGLLFVAFIWYLFLMPIKEKVS